MTNIIRTTPVGTSVFCWLSTPDTEFNKEGVYHVDLQFKKEEIQEDLKAINQAISLKIAEIHKATPSTKPIKRAPLPYKEKDGNIILKFKSKFAPKLWDKNRNLIGSDKSVWKGSTMKILYKLNPYNQSIGLGCTLYIQGVQVIDLIEGSKDGECPFPQENIPTESVLPKPELKAVY